ncbi:MAG: class I SAM-dependent methyltransferase [Pseudomonadota bacterium]
MAQLVETWSRDPHEEDSMTDEHTWIWREMIQAIDWPAQSSGRILDIGCNQGGFLRLLYDTHPFAEAVGVDLAKHAVALAESRKEDRPIAYLASERLADAGRGFDVAVSHEVIYLIDDLAQHAAQVAEVLKPGGSYFAVTCCHSDSPLWANWRPRIQAFSNLPVPNHSIGDIAESFRDGGFDVSVSRFLANAFIPLRGKSDYMPTDIDMIETYARWKMLFRFTLEV